MNSTARTAPFTRCGGGRWGIGTAWMGIGLRGAFSSSSSAVDDICPVLNGESEGRGKR